MNVALWLAWGGKLPLPAQFPKDGILIQEDLGFIEMGSSHMPMLEASGLVVRAPYEKRYQIWLVPLRYWRAYAALARTAMAPSRIGALLRDPTSAELQRELSVAVLADWHE